MAALDSIDQTDRESDVGKTVRAPELQTSQTLQWGFDWTQEPKTLGLGNGFVGLMLGGNGRIGSFLIGFGIRALQIADMQHCRCHICSGML